MPGRFALFGWGVVLSLITAAAGSSYAGAVHLASQMIEAADPRVLWAAPALIGALGIIRAASL